MCEGNRGDAASEAGEYWLIGAIRMRGNSMALSLDLGKQGRVNDRLICRGKGFLQSQMLEGEAEVVRLIVAKSHTASEQRLRDTDVLVQAADATFILCFLLVAGGGGRGTIPQSIGLSNMG